ncbi:MAG: nitrous oxide-stimulated promoter family protein [Isosphaeraceae bacterium]
MSHPPRPSGNDPTSLDPRRSRELRTVAAMIEIFCQGHHQPGRGTLCEACQSLHDYARCRLERCPFGEAKPTCADCPIHCYKPEMRAAIREVMRYSGPRMLLTHPWLAIRHLIDGATGRRTVDADEGIANPDRGRARRRYAWVVAAFAAVYLPYAWLIQPGEPWDSYRWTWIRLWPVLPGLWVAMFSSVHRLPNGLEFVVMALATVPVVALACRLAARGGLVAAISVPCSLWAVSPRIPGSRISSTSSDPARTGGQGRTSCLFTPGDSPC